MPLNAIQHERLKILEQVVRQSYNSIMITTPDVNKPEILYTNPAFTRVTGYSAEEIKGRNPRILQGPLTDREVILRLKKCIAKGEFFQGNTTNYRKDRTPFMLSGIYLLLKMIKVKLRFLYQFNMIFLLE